MITYWLGEIFLNHTYWIWLTTQVMKSLYNPAADEQMAQFQKLAKDLNTHFSSKENML